MRVAFDPIASGSTPPARQHSSVVPRAPAVPREASGASSKARSPSFAEIDVVEADLADDPRYEV